MGGTNTSLDTSSSFRVWFRTRKRFNHCQEHKSSLHLNFSGPFFKKKRYCSFLLICFLSGCGSSLLFLVLCLTSYIPFKKGGGGQRKKMHFNKFVWKLSLLIFAFLIRESASSMIIQLSSRPSGLLHLSNEMLQYRQTIKEQFSERKREWGWKR